MDQKEILSHVDHTQLKAFATWEDIQKLCEEAIEYQTASVCIPPCYIKRVHDTYGEKINICTVVGFPLGYSVTEAKAAETKKALEDGASEVDMVVNISDVKNGNYDAVQAEIAALKKITGDKILKVIIETCYLTCLLYTSGKSIREDVNLGTRESFADIAATILDIFNVENNTDGTSMKEYILKK